MCMHARPAVSNKHMLSGAKILFVKRNWPSFIVSSRILLNICAISAVHVPALTISLAVRHFYGTPSALDLDIFNNGNSNGFWDKMAIRMFEEAAHASAYAKFRPHYSTKIRDVIKRFMEKHGCGFECMADVATGSGQALAYWTDVFRKCIGLDISGEQIKNARTVFQEKGVENVEFHVCPAEDLSLGPSSCDLVTCAQAWHWLDAEKLYKEATRVLRNPGTLAVYGYGIPFFPANQKATDVTLKYHNVTLANYWHANRRHIRNHYREVELPFPVTERHDITQEWAIPLSHYMGYVGTWSGTCKYKRDNPNADPLGEVYQELKEAFSVVDADPIVDCAFPIFVILGAK